MKTTNKELSLKRIEDFFENPKLKLSKWQKYLLISSFPSFFLSLIFIKINPILSSLFMGFFSIGLITFLYLFFHHHIMSNEDDYQTYKEVGSICFKNHTIEIDDITFALNQLDELKFKVAGYNGQGNAYSKVIHDGSRNFISFNQNGETHIFQFLLLYQDQVKQLKEILQLYYDQELTIIEYYQGNRSYLLNKNLSYNEIQLLKTRFNIEMWI